MLLNNSPEMLGFASLNYSREMLAFGSLNYSREMLAFGSALAGSRAVEGRQVVGG